MLFNGAEYLRCREVYRFGSVADPVTRAALTNLENYTPIDLVSQADQKPIDQKKMIDDVCLGKTQRLVLLGEYGSGKSVTLRRMFFTLKEYYFKQKTYLCPIYLNLRDHTGQRDPVEALERHARNIGYPSNSGDIVRAWRGGLVSLLLDGFDEMATTGWGGSLEKVRSHRFSGMTLVRRFIEESPKSASIVIAGRHNFFDNQREMSESLGVSNGFDLVSTSDFSEDQAAAFLRSQNIAAQLPDWMPRRPLLLAYLAARGFLTESLRHTSQGQSPSEGWDNLLEMVCEREAQQDERLNPEAVRMLIERLSTIARRTEDGRGRIDILTIQGAFRDIVGFPPDEAAQQFILRLPALGPTSAEDSSREFVDVQIADAARAGDVLRYISHPYGSIEHFEGVVCPLGEISTNILSDKIAKDEIKPPVFINSFSVSAQGGQNSQIAMDLANVLIRSPEIALTEKIVVRGAVCEFLLLDDYSRNFSNLRFEDCLFHECEISKMVHQDNIPYFNNCLFGVLDGYFGQDDLPSHFSGCEVSSFSLGNETAASILKADIPEGLKILLTVLKKLFLQPGAGRQEGAFYRGALDSRSARLVPEILGLLAKHNIAEEVRYRGKDIWRPNRRETSRVRKIIASPMTSTDEVVDLARNL